MHRGHDLERNTAKLCALKELSLTSKLTHLTFLIFYIVIWCF